MLFLKRFLIRKDIRNCDDLRVHIEEAFSLQKLSERGKYCFDQFIDYYEYEECEIE